MSNWCYNNIVVSGNPEQLLAFKKFVKTKRSKFDFDKAIPYPKQYKLQDIKALKFNNKTKDMSDQEKFEYCNRNNIDKYVNDGFNSGGYEWCVQNWGTKWWIQEVNVSQDENYLRYNFDTAWAPPIPVIKALGERFPELKIELDYSEPGCAFEGKYVMNKGKCVVEDQWDTTPEEDEEDDEDNQQDKESWKECIEKEMK